MDLLIYLSRKQQERLIKCLNQCPAVLNATKKPSSTMDMKKGLFLQLILRIIISKKSKYTADQGFVKGEEFCFIYFDFYFS